MRSSLHDIQMLRVHAHRLLPPVLLAKRLQRYKASKPQFAALAAGSECRTDSA